MGRGLPEFTEFLHRWKLKHIFSNSQEMAHTYTQNHTVKEYGIWNMKYGIRNMEYETIELSSQPVCPFVHGAVGA